MNTEEKDLAYFQQQTAEQYGYKDWGYLKSNYSSVGGYSIFSNEVAEAYAAYRFEQGKQAGAANKLDIYNEFENWCILTNRSGGVLLGKSIKEFFEWYKNKQLIQSILNGLKQEEE